LCHGLGSHDRHSRWCGRRVSCFNPKS
jgi:hypothetical protein